MCVCVCARYMCVARFTAYIQTATDRHYVAVSQTHTHTEEEGEGGEEELGGNGRLCL